MSVILGRWILVLVRVSWLRINREFLIVFLSLLVQISLACGKCLVHCYQPQMREKVKGVMRYSGPRMLLHHPVLAMHHAVDGFKKPQKNK